MGGSRVNPMITDPIIITGAQRSGASMTAGIIAACGAFSGQCFTPEGKERHSTFENLNIRNHIVRPFLSGIGADPNGQKPLPKIELCHAKAKTLGSVWRSRVLSIMKQDGWGGELAEGWRWFVKSSSACLIWPLWAAAFPDAKWVIVRRGDKEVVRACLATAFMRAYHDDAGWSAWIATHRERFEEMKSSMAPRVLEFWPESIVRGELADARSMIGALGLNWHEDQVEEFMAPALWKAGIFEMKG